MDKIIVTGGAGFIGSYLAEELVSEGYDVTILDNLSTGKVENIKNFLNNIKFIEGSINDRSLLEKSFHDVDFIFHLAAIPGVSRSVDDPRSSHETNLAGTLNVLLAARDNKVKKVVYASSSAVYGDTPNIPHKEDMTLHPISPYAVSKLAGEYYCLVFNQIYGLANVCLRYFNVYGPRQDHDSEYAAVIPRFIKSLFEGDPPVIFGSGKQTRDFTFVKDAVKANILAVKNDARGVFNISLGKSTTINRLAELTGELMGNKIEPIYKEPRPGDILHSLADISKARTFGFEPEYDLEAGLKETIQRFRD